MKYTLEWLGEQVLELINGGLVGICNTLAPQTSLFVLVALVGAYFIMMGNKQTGSKIMSTSVITYLIIKVVSASC